MKTKVEVVPAATRATEESVPSVSMEPSSGGDVRLNSSGFYHDPSAGWYYSSKDGRYYRFEDGHYVAWNSDEKNENPQQSTCNAFEDASQDHSGMLEETLINLYLSGYSNELANARCSSTYETDADTYEERHNEETFDVEDAMNIVEEAVEEAESSGRPFEEGDYSDADTSRCEENWLAQYGQVVKPEDEAALAFPVVDLWEWRLVEEIGKGRKKVMRLAGRLAKRSVKVHPSVSAGGGFLKTARICEVYLDLVQVETGISSIRAAFLLCYRRTNKGLLQPLQVAGNKGTAGLGWRTERVVQ
ncbi:unnamed protein product [Spirodela intermedia]|uniref:OCRE domain-containing protein n=1 Tax=Spirodela intermedia TaxID=51605 RepID=A0A7I8J690_SPIIN|nr:unnamed protein product [Spirodela intermedia]CAA6665510.1 unnamed protein product [Spirodela intermedia]